MPSTLTEQISVISSPPLSSSDPMGSANVEQDTVHDEAISVQDLVHCNVYKMMSDDDSEEYGCGDVASHAVRQ